MEAREVALVAVVAVAPLAIVMIFAFIRGYTIDMHMTRKRTKEEQEDDKE